MRGPQLADAACCVQQVLPLPCAHGAAHGACSLRDFKAAMAPFVPVDFGEECAKGVPTARQQHAA